MKNKPYCKFLFFIYLIFFYILLFRTHLIAGDVMVKVLPESEVKGAFFTMDEISNIYGKDPCLIQRLKDIVISRSPLPKDNKVIPGELINLRIRQKKDIDLQRIEVNVPDKIVVNRAYTIVTKEDMFNIIVDFIHSHVNNKKEDLKILNFEAKEMIFPQDEISYKVSLPHNSRIAGLIKPVITFYLNGKKAKKVRVSLTVNIYKDVVTAKHIIHPHRILKEKDLTLEYKNLADYRSEVITDISEVLGKRSKRTIYAGEVITLSEIDTPPLIKRGDIITIVAESEALKVSALGEARQNGVLGKQIKVMNLSSQKIIMGKVLDSSTVKVNF